MLDLSCPRHMTPSHISLTPYLALGQEKLVVREGVCLPHARAEGRRNMQAYTNVRMNATVLLCTRVPVLERVHVRIRVCTTWRHPASVWHHRCFRRERQDARTTAIQTTSSKPPHPRRALHVPGRHCSYTTPDPRHCSYNSYVCVGFRRCRLPTPICPCTSRAPAASGRYRIARLKHAASGLAWRWRWCCAGVA